MCFKVWNHIQIFFIHALGCIKWARGGWLRIWKDSSVSDGMCSLIGSSWCPGHTQQAQVGWSCLLKMGCSTGQWWDPCALRRLLFLSGWTKSALLSVPYNWVQACPPEKHLLGLVKFKWIALLWLIINHLWIKLRIDSWYMPSNMLWKIPQHYNIPHYILLV